MAEAQGLRSDYAVRASSLPLRVGALRTSDVVLLGIWRGSPSWAGPGNWQIWRASLLRRTSVLRPRTWRTRGNPTPKDRDAHLRPATTCHSAGGIVPRTSCDGCSSGILDRTICSQRDGRSAPHRRHLRRTGAGRRQTSTEASWTNCRVHPACVTILWQCGPVSHSLPHLQGRSPRSQSA